MKQTGDGSFEFEINDTIQVVRGEDLGTFGIVCDVAGPQLNCWGRVPAQYGSAAYEFQVNINNVMYVGKGKIRPLKPGEIKRTIEEASQLAAPAQAISHARIPKAPPNLPPPPAERSEGRGQLVAFGKVDSDQIDTRPHPPAQDNLDPKMLSPAVFRGPSALEAHGITPSAPPGLPKEPAHETIQTGSQDAGEIRQQGQEGVLFSVARTAPEVRLADGNPQTPTQPTVRKPRGRPRMARPETPGTGNDVR